MNYPVAIVTGASRGIGKSTALLLHANGYVVVGLYKSDEHAVDSLLAQSIDMHKADVGYENDVKKVIGLIADKYGRIDVLVNNAGINLQRTIETCTFEEWERLIATDLTSVFLMSKYVIPYLGKSDNGCIVNVSSRIGLNDYAEAEFVPYSAAKAGVNNFTVGLARELSKSNIRVNAIIPTPTKTDLLDQVFTVEDEKTLAAKGKLGTPEDVAGLIFDVIADRSKTGELIFDKRVFL